MFKKCDRLYRVYHNWAYEKVGVLPIRIVKSNVSSVGLSSEKNRLSL